METPMSRLCSEFAKVGTTRTPHAPNNLARTSSHSNIRAFAFARLGAVPSSAMVYFPLLRWTSCCLGCGKLSMTPVNEASVLGLTVYFPGSRYTLKLPDLSVLNVMDSPFEFRAVNVPFRMGFSSAPKMRPDTMSADAGKENHIEPAMASAIIAHVIRLSLGKRCVCDMIRSYPARCCSSSYALLVRITSSVILREANFKLKATAPLQSRDSTFSAAC